MKNICLILEDRKITKLMRRFDLCEDWKFFGLTVNASKKEDGFIPFPMESDEFFLVAQILDGSIKIHHDYMESYMSDGKIWFKLSDYCNYLLSTMQGEKNG